MDKWFTFDDVAILPQFNNISSRTEPSLKTWITRSYTVQCPILAANMDTVISPELARVLVDYGIKPIWHRFADVNQIFEWADEFPNSILSCGLDSQSIVNAKAVAEKVDIVALLIDIAHGHDSRVLHKVEKLTKDGFNVIAGNVCTADGYRDLVNAGAVAVKVGIGPGYACTTRKVTGFGGPQFTAIQTVGEAAKKLRVPIIADGGIRGSRECVLGS
jgi:IMP dehydrogenase